MAVTRERFEQGMSYQAYKEQMTRNRERLEANEAAVQLDPEDVAFFANLPKPLNVLVLAEDWCGDVINNLPVIGKLAEATDKLDLRILLRDQHLDIMDQYLHKGEFRSIPAVIILDENFQALGHWNERPDAVTELQAQMRRDLFTNDPLLKAYTPETPFADLPEEARERLRTASANFFEQNRHFSNRAVIHDLRKLIEGQAGTANSASSTIALASNGDSVATTTAARPKISITYCAECGYENQTLSLVSTLMTTFLTEIATIEILPWQDGAFDVTVNGDLVHSMYRDGGFPENETIIAAVRERIA
jgi:selenoprotein W-related protein